MPSEHTLGREERKTVSQSLDSPVRLLPPLKTCVVSATANREVPLDLAKLTTGLLSVPWIQLGPLSHGFVSKPHLELFPQGLQSDKRIDGMMKQSGLMYLSEHLSTSRMTCHLMLPTKRVRPPILSRAYEVVTLAPPSLRSSAHRSPIKPAPIATKSDFWGEDSRLRVTERWWKDWSRCLEYIEKSAFIRDTASRSVCSTLEMVQPSILGKEKVK